MIYATICLWTLYRKTNFSMFMDAFEKEALASLCWLVAGRGPPPPPPWPPTRHRDSAPWPPQGVRTARTPSPAQGVRTGWLLTWPTEQGLGSEDGFCRVPATWLWPAEFELAKSVLHAQATADKTGPVYPAGREPPGDGLARPCSHGDSGMGRVPTGSPDSSNRSLRRLFWGCSEG